MHSWRVILACALVALIATAFAQDDAQCKKDGEAEGAKLATELCTSAKVRHGTSWVSGQLSWTAAAVVGQHHQQRHAATGIVPCKQRSLMILYESASNHCPNDLQLFSKAFLTAVDLSLFLSLSSLFLPSPLGAGLLRRWRDT